MHVAHLSLHDFRSYAALDLELGPGVTTFVGRNGQGKTNLVEAIDYLSRLTSHRMSGDGPLVRRTADGPAEQAVVRAAVVRDDRRAVLEIEINPGRSNRARVNRSPLPRARDLLGLVRTVVFSPEDLALVKGDPAERRRFLDDLLVQLAPRYAGIRSDYDRVLKQRNSLLKSMAAARRGRARSPDEFADATLEVWDARLVEFGSEIVRRRHTVVDELGPRVGKNYEAVARGATREDARLAYRPGFALSDDPAAEGAVEEAFTAALADRRLDEVDRGLTLVGPHRDELTLELGGMPARGYASHGESWSFALALRLACHDLIRADGDDPVLVLDDVFAELDAGRREQLADLVADAEQVLITAAVAADVPARLQGNRFTVADGEVRADG